MEQKNNPVLRQFSDETDRASKENEPPSSGKLSSPIKLKSEPAYKRLIGKRSFRTEESKHSRSVLRSEANEHRHVTFDEDSKHRGLAAFHPAFRHRQRPPPGRARAATPLDLRVGGMESLECLPQQLKISKNDPAFLQLRLEELTRENGYLQQELLYHKDTLSVMNNFFESIRRAHHSLQNALAETARKVAISEQRLLDCYSRQPYNGSYEDNVF
ncbi:hypothetical protein ACLMJK_001367 [Lecanora helva]